MRSMFMKASKMKNASPPKELKPQKPIEKIEVEELDEMVDELEEKPQ